MILCWGLRGKVLGAQITFSKLKSNFPKKKQMLESITTSANNIFAMCPLKSNMSFHFDRLRALLLRKHSYCSFQSFQRAHNLLEAVFRFVWSNSMTEI